VADRQNNRVQVFDTDGKFKQEWPLDGPRVVPLHHAGTQPGDLRRQRRQGLQMGLDGKVLGTFGKLGRLPGWFDSIHAIAARMKKPCTWRTSSATGSTRSSWNKALNHHRGDQM